MAPSDPQAADDEEAVKSWDQFELLAVLAVMRHGDRTPKTKIKLTTSHPSFIELHSRWQSNISKPVVLKAPHALQDVLDLTISLLGGDGHAPVKEKELRALEQIRSVLEEVPFTGIHRKVQLKPKAFDHEPKKVTSLLVIIKFGGVLTPAGINQAAALGHYFRRNMYPESHELLSLHSTQRHDFKVYSSDEGRVQMSAAAFASGLLDLEAAELTPICVALVENDTAMLDDLPNQASSQMQAARKVLEERIVGTTEEEGEELRQSRPSFNVLKDLHNLKGYIDALCTELEALDPSCVDVVECRRAKQSIGNPRAADDEEGHQERERHVVCSTTHLETVVARWRKLRKELLDVEHERWDISKVTEIYDAVRYDMIHHRTLAESLTAVYSCAKPLNEIIVANEYGFDEMHRARIGSTVCRRLMRTLIDDMELSRSSRAKPEMPEAHLVSAVEYMIREGMISSENECNDPEVETEDNDEEEARPEATFAELLPGFAQHLNGPNRRVRTRVYFTSESHIQSLMGWLRYCHLLPGSLPDVVGKCVTPLATPQNSAGTEVPTTPAQATHQLVAPSQPTATQPNATPPQPTAPPQQVTASDAAAQPEAATLPQGTPPQAAPLLPQVQTPEEVPPEATSSPQHAWPETAEVGGRAEVGEFDRKIAVPPIFPEADNFVVSPEAEARMREEPVFDYLTQLVFRLYEDKHAPASAPERYRVEVLFSPGAAADPLSLSGGSHTMPLSPLEPLHAPGRPPTLKRLKELFQLQRNSTTHQTPTAKDGHNLREVRAVSEAMDDIVQVSRPPTPVQM
eukprot:NODE_628_length_2878_cov_10.851690.p1 GENE.NODE_628_length_2878_cov_10.851690~~NODE_628_length_2878_cov_10.851690.p1  ORF type:complete len:892 (-),score=254.60 NODE_628_length_2878_cov_10.851690:201-2600(-)